MSLNLDGDLRTLQDDFRARRASNLRFTTGEEIRKSRSPIVTASILFGDAVKYGSVLQDIEASRPFFEGAKIAFGLAETRPTESVAGESVYSTLYNRYLMNFGLLVSTEVLAGNERPSDVVRIGVARAALQMAFTEKVFADAKRRPQTFRTPEFSTYLLTYVAICLVSRFWGAPVQSVEFDRIIALPLAREFEPLRDALARCLLANEGDSSANEELQRAFREKVNPAAYEMGLIGNLRFTDAYPLSLAKEQGKLVSAVTRMFD
jgi:hypothetical protein